MRGLVLKEVVNDFFFLDIAMISAEAGNGDGMKGAAEGLVDALLIFTHPQVAQSAAGCFIHLSLQLLPQLPSLGILHCKLLLHFRSELLLDLGKLSALLGYFLCHLFLPVLLP
jgi:hypothetical protein